ncbi:MAG: COG4705 family protein [Ramlibacter sp.]
MQRDAHHAFAKVPQVTLLFWLAKIIATTLGETAGDAVTMSMNLGYLVGTAIFAVFFLVTAGAQVAAQRFHPALFWTVIIATTTVGTTLADFCDRSLGIGYAGGASILFVLLMGSLLWWRASLGSVSVNRIDSRKAELFYWATILFSQTLGTALGDWFADPDTGLGLGYEGSALVFGAALAVIAALYLWTKVSRTALFWAAFILTRPLGATVGDFLDKPVADGGLALSRYSASAWLVAAIVAYVLLVPQKAERLAVGRER